MDYLIGLKENIILGQLIPAGTGIRRYYDMFVSSENGNIFGREFKERIEIDNMKDLQEKLHRSIVEDIQAEMAEAIGHKDEKISEMTQGSEHDLFSEIEP